MEGDAGAETNETGGEDMEAEDSGAGGDGVEGEKVEAIGEQVEMVTGKVEQEFAKVVMTMNLWPLTPLATRNRSLTLKRVSPPWCCG